MFVAKLLILAAVLAVALASAATTKSPDPKLVNIFKNILAETHREERAAYEKRSMQIAELKEKSLARYILLQKKNGKVESDLNRGLRISQSTGQTDVKTSSATLKTILLEATEGPTSAPTRSPTFAPSKAPTFVPNRNPTLPPSEAPTFIPTLSMSPTNSFKPIALPTYEPTQALTTSPKFGDDYLSLTFMSKNGKNLDKNKKRCRNLLKMDKNTGLPKYSKISHTSNEKASCSPYLFSNTNSHFDGTGITDDVTYSLGSTAMSIVVNHATKKYELTGFNWLDNTNCFGRPNWNESLGSLDYCADMGTPEEPHFAKLSHGKAKVAHSFVIGYYDRDPSKCDYNTPSWWLFNETIVPKDRWPDTVISYQLGGCINDYSKKESISMKSCKMSGEKFTGTVQYFKGLDCKAKNFEDEITDVDLNQIADVSSAVATSGPFGCQRQNVTSYDDYEDDGEGKVELNHFKLACVSN